MRARFRRGLAIGVGLATATSGGVVVAGPAAAEVAFGPVVEYSAVGVFDLVLGDLDGDGDLDQVASGQRARIQVRLGLGNGELGPATTLSVPEARARLALGDVDADGDLDLAAVAQFSASAYLFPGNGAGGFAPARSVGVRRSVSEVSLTDLDGNGTADLVMTNADPGRLIVRLASGGRLGPAREYPTGALDYQDTEIADVDGDGILDAVVVTDGRPAVLLGDGAGRFATRLLSSSPNELRQSALGDVDGDGDLDLLAEYRTAVVAVASLLNDGTGRFTWVDGVQVNSYYSAGLAATDLDGDGHADAVITDGEVGGFFVLQGTVEGRLGAPSDGPFIYAAGEARFGDLNGDGSPDLVADAIDIIGVSLNRSSAG